MIPRPPAIPASLGALVMLAGIGLMYWSLTGLGLLKGADTAAPATATGAVAKVGTATGAVSDRVTNG